MCARVHAAVCGVYSHSGDVFTREGIGGVANQQTGLTHSPEEVRRHSNVSIQLHTDQNKNQIYIHGMEECMHGCVCV